MGDADRRTIEAGTPGGGLMERAGRAGGGGRRVAVDPPRGTGGRRGLALGRGARATSTVTFAARKPGRVSQPGRAHAGRVVVADIGIDLGGDEHAGLVTADDVRGWW